MFGIIVTLFMSQAFAQSTFMDDLDDQPLVLPRDSRPSPQRPPPPPTAQAGCSPKKLNYKGNGIPDPRTSPAGSVWGGTATDAGNSAPLKPEFIAAARVAKSRGLHTMMYLEGPCGPTAGSDASGEQAACRRKFGSDWQGYTIRQLKMSARPDLKIDYCEIDNLDRGDFMGFMQKYKTLFDRGEIHCRLVLKNLDVGDIRALAKFKPQSGGVDFISNLHIKEVGGNSCASGVGRDWTAVQNRVDVAFRELKGPGAKTVASKDTCNYESSNFTQDTFLSCPGGRPQQQQPDSPALIGDAAR